MDTRPSPASLMREAWSDNPMELAVPAAVAVLLAHTTTAFFMLRSPDALLLWLCLGLVAWSTAHSILFLARALGGARWGAPPELTGRETWLLITPLGTSVLLYALIAPDARFGIFFALITLPRLYLLLYFIKYHARAAISEKLQTSGALNQTTGIVRWHELAINSYTRVQRGAQAAWHAVGYRRLSRPRPVRRT